MRTGRSSSLIFAAREAVDQALRVRGRPGGVSFVEGLPQVVCLVAQAVAGAPRAAIRGDGKNGSTPATTPGEPRGEEIAGPWPRCGVPALRRHDAPSDSPVR